MRRHKWPVWLQNAAFFAAKPLWVNAALEKAVKTNPAERYQSMSEFIGDLTRPNLNFKPKEMVPLIERDPIGFWKGLAVILAIINLILLYLLYN